MPVLQFIGAAVGATVMLSITSIVWPKVTSEPRPGALTKVHDMVMETKAGQDLANTLGVSDERAVQPVSISSVASSAVQNAVTAVSSQAQSAVTTHVLEMVVKQVEQLSPQDQEKFRQLICAPAE